MDQFTPLQLPLQPFWCIVNLWFILVFKEKATTNEKTRGPEQRKGGEGAAGLPSKESHARASLISKCCLPQL